MFGDFDRDMYFDRAGKPITADEWMQLHRYGPAFETYCRVAETQINGYWISTVWLGMNHNFGEGEPLIFETMIFRGTKGGKANSSKVLDDDYDEYQVRYATEDEAKIGHQAAVYYAQELSAKVALSEFGNIIAVAIAEQSLKGRKLSE